MGTISITKNIDTKSDHSQNNVTFQKIIRQILINTLIDKGTAMKENHHWTGGVQLRKRNGKAL